MSHAGPVKDGLQNVWGGEACLEGAALKEKKTYILREKMMSWSGDFDIKDDQDNICYKVKGKVLTLRDVMTILNPSGEPVAVLKAKLAACRATYQLYKYEPNQPGQKSTDEEDGRPLYRFAWMAQRCCNCLMKVDYGLYKGND